MAVRAPSAALAGTSVNSLAPGKLRACAFDLGGVLMSYHPKHRLSAFAEQTGLTRDDVRRRLFDSGFGRSLDEGRIKTGEVAKRVNTLLGKRLGESTIETCWAQAFQPMDPTIALAASLRPDLATAVVSNNNELTRRALRRVYPDALEGFRPVLFSSDVGCCKPDATIFLSLATLLDCEPAEVLVVDDDALNITMADSLGFQTHHYRDARTLATALTELTAA